MSHSIRKKSTDDFIFGIKAIQARGELGTYIRSWRILSQTSDPQTACPDWQQVSVRDISQPCYQSEFTWGWSQPETYQCLRSWNAKWLSCLGDVSALILLGLKKEKVAEEMWRTGEWWATLSGDWRHSSQLLLSPLYIFHATPSSFPNQGNVGGRGTREENGQVESSASPTTNLLRKWPPQWATLMDWPCLELPCASCVLCHCI